MPEARGDHRRDRERVRRHAGDRTGCGTFHGRSAVFGDRDGAKRPVRVSSFHLARADGANLIRPISARYMHAKEVQHYERR